MGKSVGGASVENDIILFFRYRTNMDLNQVHHYTKTIYQNQLQIWVINANNVCPAERKNWRNFWKKWLSNNHYVKSVKMQSFFWSVFSCIWTEYRKIRTRQNSVFGHFSHSNIFHYIKSILQIFITNNKLYCRTL